MKLAKNNINTACFRLNTKTTLTADTVYYLFKVVNSSTRQEILFTGQDISNNSALYNEFQIIETGTTYVNLTASTISLAPAGWWSLKIYEMSGQTNLDISGTTGQPIAYGKIEVIDTTGTTQGMTYTYTGESNTRFVYQP